MRVTSINILKEKNLERNKFLMSLLIIILSSLHD